MAQLDKHCPRMESPLGSGPNLIPPRTEATAICPSNITCKVLKCHWGKGLGPGPDPSIPVGVIFFQVMFGNLHKVM